MSLGRMANTFKYFGYGSNLSRYRLSMSCPSAKKVCVGSLDGYKLGFGKHSVNWRGGVASIIRTGDTADKVCGIIWDINEEEIPMLDEQEGVKRGSYISMQVDVKNESGESLSCRTYQLRDLGGEQEYCAPSPQYLGVILDGAMKHQLPVTYVEKLKSIETNKNDILTDHIKWVHGLKQKEDNEETICT